MFKDEAEGFDLSCWKRRKVSEAGKQWEGHVRGGPAAGVDSDAPGGALRCPGHSAVQVWWPEHRLCDPGVGGGVRLERALGGPGVQGRA